MVKEKPIQTEIGEWLYKGCYIVEQDHPMVLKYHVFEDTPEQQTVGTTNKFSTAKFLCEENEKAKTQS